jgi:hypothetical protein
LVRADIDLSEISMKAIAANHRSIPVTMIIAVAFIPRAVLPRRAASASIP